MKRLPRGISRTAAGSYEVRLTVGRRDGRQVRRKATFRALADAEEFLREAVRARQYGAWGLAPPDGPAPAVTLEAACRRHADALDALGRSEHHVRSSGHHHRLLIAALGPGRRLPLGEEEVLGLVRWLRETRTTRGSLVAHVLTTLRAVHARAGLAAPRTPAIRIEYRGRRVLPLGALRAFLAALPAGSVERLTALLVLLLAARESEVLRLRIGDVDVEAGTVALRRVKGWQATGGTATVVVRAPAALVAELRGWIAGLRPGLPVDAPLLSADKGKRWRPLNPHSLMGRLRRASAQAEISPPITTLGWLRNQAATLLGETQVETGTLQRLLGHSTPVQTARYDRSRRDVAQAVERERLATLALGPDRGHEPGGTDGSGR